MSDRPLRRPATHLDPTHASGSEAADLRELLEFRRLKREIEEIVDSPEPERKP